LKYDLSWVSDGWSFKIGQSQAENEDIIINYYFYGVKSLALIFFCKKNYLWKNFFLQQKNIFPIFYFFILSVDSFKKTRLRRSFSLAMWSALRKERENFLHKVCFHKKNISNKFYFFTKNFFFIFLLSNSLINLFFLINYSLQFNFRKKLYFYSSSSEEEFYKISFHPQKDIPSVKKNPIKNETCHQIKKIFIRCGR